MGGRIGAFLTVLASLACVAGMHALGGLVRGCSKNSDVFGRAAARNVDTIADALASDARRSMGKIPRGETPIPHPNTDGRLGKGLDINPPKFGDLIPEVDVRFRAAGELNPKLKYHNPTFGGFRIISVIPDEGSFAKVFPGRNLSAPALDKFNALGEEVLTMQNSHLMRNSGDGLKALESSFTSSGPDELIVLIGHSESKASGRVFVLPDGSKVGFEELHRMCSLHERHLLIVSCKSPDLGINFDISYKVAIRLMKELSREAPISKSQVIGRLQHSLKIKNTLSNICYVTTAGAAAGSAIWIASPGKRND